MPLQSYFFALLTVVFQIVLSNGQSKELELELMLQSVARDPGLALDKIASSIKIPREEVYLSKREFNQNLDSNVDLAYFERITNQTDLFQNVIKDLINRNIKNGQIYLDSLVKSSMKSNECKGSFVRPEYDRLCRSLAAGECDADLCDLNADCSRVKETVKCQCRQGFVGDGSRGNCYNGTFCSGKFCRFNGQCIFSNSVKGYRCKCMLECQNGGQCVQRPNRYECLCSRNFTGPLCTESSQTLISDYKNWIGFKSGDTSNWVLLRNLASLVGPWTNGSQNFLLDQLKVYLNQRTKEEAEQVPNQNFFVF